MPGPDGTIAMDIAYWHNNSSDAVLVISSGTHGIEGYCGSFVQCALMDEGVIARAAENASVLLIHGVNPFGFAWQRRVNEDNIDLNRNFIDHASPHPVNEGYRELADLLEPSEWHDDTDKQINRGLSAAAKRHSDDPRWLQAAMSGGQYEFPNGLFFGGLEPSWSYQAIMQVADTHLRNRDVIWIDIHTALGEFGTAQCIVDIPPESPQLQRAQALWGDRVGNIAAESSVAVNVSGTVVEGVQREMGQSILWTGLEYGTVDPGEVGLSLIQDQWLHRHGELSSEMGRSVKSRMMNTFFPDESRWRSAVLDIAHEVVLAPCP